jgi:hypothetical protein
MRFQQVMGCVAAFLFAAIAPAILMGVLVPPYIPVVFLNALQHALVVGLPIFLICWWMRWVNAITCVLVGFLVGAASGVLPYWPSVQPKGGHVSVRGVPLVVDGVPTAAAWQDFLQTLGFLGLLGATGGIAFWLVLRASGTLAPATTERSEQGSYWIAGAGRATSLAVAAVLLSIAVVAVPLTAGTDRTCHNVLRDGRQSIAPQVSMDLPITGEALAELTRATAEFAATKNLSFRDSSKPEALFLSLCHDRGLTIHLSPGVSIAVFEVHAGSDWQRTTKDLIDRIETLWPGKLRFRAPQGGDMPRPKELQ